MQARIAFVISSLNPGGAERVVSLVASGLALRGHPVRVITLGDANADDLPLDGALDRITLGLAADSTNLFERVRNNLTRLARLRGALMGFAPNVIVSFGDQTNVLALLSTLGLPVPIIVSERVHPVGNTTPPVWRALRRITYPHAKALVVQAKSIGAAFSGMTGLRQEVIRNPLPHSAFAAGSRQPDSDTACDVVALGRLVDQKGFDRLIDAFGVVVRSVPEARLRIYGEGPERTSLIRQIERLGLQSAVSMMGFTRDVVAVLSGADMFVLSSRFEGMPNIMLEAMALGTPTIAADCPGAVSEVAGGGEYAYLVDTDNTGALADAMVTLLRDRGLRVSYGARALRGARRYEEQVVLDHWQALIGEVAAQTGADA